MKAIEDIRDIFSILHDGTIIAWTGNNELLTLTIECLYLAERIEKSFDRFYVKLYNIDKIELDAWANDFNFPNIVKTDIADIFKAELDILSTNIKNDTVIVTCNQDNRGLDYCGGNLTISCQTIKIFDQNNNELTIEQFGKICDEYWDEFSKR